jgi:hypothetical protein
MALELCTGNLQSASQEVEAVVMSATGSALGVNTVPLGNAVFCVNCEMISDSTHDLCTVCGSRSLVGLFRVLGGTLRKRSSEPIAELPKTVKYHLELSVDAHEISARDLNHAIELLSHLSEVGGVVERMHINVESRFEEEQRPTQKAA